jgi:DNA invertase Pin-like site-specific DNA recombinase
VVIGYVGASRADDSQVLELQHETLLGAGIPAIHHYGDHATGRCDDRAGLEACLKALRKGDTLVIRKLDSLGRDLRHFVNLFHDLPGRGLGMKDIAGQGANLDTTTADGRLVFGIFADLAEFLRELIVERARAGLVSARDRGRHGRGPFKITAANLRLAQAAMGQNDTKVGGLCRELGVTRRTLCRRLDPSGALRPDEEKLVWPAARRQSSNARPGPMSS